ncbi:uncharacterized protein At4g10930 [Dendrobium catenatum]|uniref:PHD and RING finger domain-containing protein 1 n=1 Tax=Dendrobium catenatum TaxID=906689 RepID=A0A2I0VWB8_9ASPA|nr:uncharacterized protein At4g10930 [Dendrobium catenatum]PKU67697.1 Uncharacterized protein MA16_Dca013727 [Dendrobium catenatum]
MDLQWGNDDESESIGIEDEDCNIDSVFEQERCGICIDIVIDRGVLDCCDHWFCFACIDNWAIITNLCPICKNEFQHITCLPVYDTIRSIRLEEHPPSRNEDWYFQGKNNTLSFPSYYISEDAVQCLENDGCKIRSMMQETEDDLSFDTSIACDSCDTWYHAFCVGFNPEFTSENSWLCPRCINNEVPQKLGAVSLQSSLKYSSPQTAEIGWTVDPSLSGKVAVSVDAGETAVVVSMIEGKQKTDCGTSFFDSLDSKKDLVIEKSSFYSDFENSATDFQLNNGSCIQVSQNSLLFSDDKEHHTNASDVNSSSECIFDISPEIIDFQPYAELKEATISSFFDDAASNKQRNDISESQQPLTLQDVPFSLSYSEANDKGITINALATSLSVYSDVYVDSSSVAHGTPKAKDEPDNSSDNIIGTCSAAAPLSSVDNMVTSCNEDMVVDIFQKNREGCNLTEKPTMNMTCSINMNGNNGCNRKKEPETVYPMKKLKLDGKSKTFPAGNQSDLSSLDVSQVRSRENRDARLRYAKKDDAEAPDIMSIVQESYSTSHDMPAEMKAANKSIGKKDGACGLRVKKIMRRVGEKKESSIIVQELGKEIREVVQHKASKGGGKSNFDEKLLEAFRAAIVRPKTKLTSRSELVHIGAKKPLLIKGKKRENLTKKIYGTVSGRRRHAWARDLEIEFWKHRCRRAQPDKVETLQSVLELLKKATDPNWNSSMERDSHEESEDSILSRVYIADASLFPRKDDIKPLSALSGSSQLDNHIQEKEGSSINIARGTLNDDKNSKKNSIQISKNSLQLKANYCDSIGKNIHSSCFPGETSNCKANSCQAAADPLQSSGSSGSKDSIATSKEHSCLSDAKTDKRKWALEVLARKTASANLNANNKGQEDGDFLKGKYPLLAQLPQDMRPVLASTRHNKVSGSVRQIQLYRITEHYLRRANLPVIRRIAETELAVADAVNVEKDIFERSNSKLVYVNLCSLVVSQLVNKPVSPEENASNSPKDTLMISNEVAEGTKSDTETDNNPESAERNVSNSTLPASEVSNEALGERSFSPKVGGWSNVEEALKLAGLFSDSPPSSPYCATNISNEDESTQENVNDGINYDSQSNILHSMDIERDVSMTQNSGKAVAAYDCINVEVKLPFDFSKSLEEQKESEPDNSQADHRMENVLPRNMPESGLFDEPSLEECEGDNEDHPMGQISDEAVEVLNKPLVIGEEPNPISGLKENCILNDAARVSVTDTENCTSGPDGGSAHVDETLAGVANLETHSRENVQNNPDICDTIPSEEIAKLTNDKSDLTISISKKVEAYIKEHIRPLCKSGVITVEQYRWAVGKTLDKVMKFHRKAKNANFLIREGEKVKKLAEQYVEAAQQRELR